MVGQRVLLQITPNVFHGIEFGGVGREVFQIEAEMPVKERFDFSGPVGARAIPDHHEVSRQLAEQLQEKVQGSIRVDVLVGVQTEVEVKSVASGRHGQRAHTRDLLTGPAALIENGGLAARSPKPRCGFLGEKLLPQRSLRNTAPSHGAAKSVERYPSASRC